MCFKNLKKKMKNLDMFDISLTKLSVASFVLFIITIWPAALSLVLSVNPWYFLIAFILLAMRPFYRFIIKK